ncbi:MAG: type IV secretory system conjugative DNA transfer family protein [Rhizobiaceae bacterium]
MDKIRLGVRWNPRTGRAGRRVSYNLRSHFTMIGPSSVGKGVCLELPNLLLGLRRCAVVSIDPSGQNAAVCAEARRRFGHTVLPLNPFNLHVADYPDLQDIGFNPLVAIDPASPHFFMDAASLADALITVEGDHQRHFPESARGLLTWLIMFVRLHDGIDANLGTVRDLLTGDLSSAAQAAVATGHPRIINLAGQYVGELSRELQSVVSTARTQTRWLSDDIMRASLARNGVDFASLKDRPCKSVFLILPAGIELEFHGTWLRVVINCALNALYRRGTAGGVPVVFMLSEFAQLGRLPSILAAFGQARKYGIRLWTVLQNIGQIREIYGPHGAETFVANSGCVLSYTAADPGTAEFASLFSGEQAALTMHVSNNPQGGPPNVSYGVQTERVWTPGQIRELPEFHGLVWKFGQSKPQPVYLPPYYEMAACRRRMRADPYFLGSRGGLGWPLRFVARALVPAALVAVAFGGAVLLRSGPFGLPDLLRDLPAALRPW